MEIIIRRNWLGKFLIYENDNEDYSFYGHSSFLFGRGNTGKIFDRQKEQVLFLQEGRIPKIWKPSDKSFTIKLVKEKIDIDLECVDYRTHWTFNFSNDKFDLRLFDDHEKLFRNDIHVATYLTDSYDYFKTIKVNADINELILISLGLVFQIDND